MEPKKFNSTCKIVWQYVIFCGFFCNFFFHFIIIIIFFTLYMYTVNNISCFSQYGPIEKMNVCDNLGDHLVGNVYIKVRTHVCQDWPAVEWIPLLLIVAASLCVHLSLCFFSAMISYYFTSSFLTLFPILLLCGLPLLCFQFTDEEIAEKAVQDLNNRWFNGQPIHAELSPVTDFREACCRQYDNG